MRNMHLKCPRCGAPIQDFTLDKCPYCGASYALPPSPQFAPPTLKLKMRKPRELNKAGLFFDYELQQGWTVEITQQCLNEMLTFAEQCYPNECRGWVFGKIDKQKISCRIAVPARVWHATSGMVTRVLDVSDEELKIVDENLRKMPGQTLVGEFHLHPGYEHHFWEFLSYLRKQKELDAISRAFLILLRELDDLTEQMALTFTWPSDADIYCTRRVSKERRTQLSDIRLAIASLSDFYSSITFGEWRNIRFGNVLYTMRSLWLSDKPLEESLIEKKEILSFLVEIGASHEIIEKVKRMLEDEKGRVKFEDLDKILPDQLIYRLTPRLIKVFQRGEFRRRNVLLAAAATVIFDPFKGFVDINPRIQIGRTYEVHICPLCGAILEEEGQMCPYCGIKAD